MKFITDRVERRNTDRETRFPPVPGTHILFLGLTLCAPDQKAQNGVFNRMGAFANHKLNGINGFVGNGRIKPPQDRANDAGGALAGHQAGGACEYEAHPQDHRQPVFDELRHS